MSGIRQQMESLLKEQFFSTHVHVEDQSHLHRGHRESRDHGGGHFQVTIVSDVFEGLSSLQRHRRVYQALSSLKDHIHALSMQTLTIQEWHEHG